MYNGDFDWRSGWIQRNAIKNKPRITQIFTNYGILQTRRKLYYSCGLCMEVHRILGPGLLEIVYKDALEIEFKNNNIPFEREKEFPIEYKGNLLPHKFYADFIIYDEIILEIKSVKEINKEHIAQTLNYMKLADSQVGIIANFQNKSLTHKRLVF